MIVQDVTQLINVFLVFLLKDTQGVAKCQKKASSKSKIIVLKAESEQAVVGI